MRPREGKSSFLQFVLSIKETACMRFKKGFVFLFFISIFLEAGAMPSYIDIPVKKYRLKNGLTVLLNPNPNSSLVAYYWGIPIGSRHEKKGITGLSHMFEHLMFRGTKKYPNMDKLYDENGVVGVNAHTSYDFTGYLGKFPPEKLSLILDVESDRIANLLLTEEVLNKERKAVQEERYMSLENNPRGLLYEALMSLVFKKHSYKWPIIGYKEDIASYNLEDLKKWYKTHYSPNNIVLTLSGPFKEKEAEKEIEKYFGPLKSQSQPEFSDIEEPEQEKARHLTLKKAVQTTEVRLAYRGPKENSKEFLALEAVALILGAGESGRLYKKIVRENKLLHGIFSGTMDFVDYSLFLIYFTLPLNAKEALVKSLVLKEIQNIADKSVTQKELGKVRNILLDSQINSLKQSGSRAYKLAYYEIQYKDYRKLYEKLEAVQNLSPDFIKSVTQKYLDPKRLSYVKMEPL